MYPSIGLLTGFRVIGRQPMTANRTNAILLPSTELILSAVALIALRHR